MCTRSFASLSETRRKLDPAGISVSSVIVQRCDESTENQEIALKMSRWLGLAPSYTRKAYLLEFVDVLVGIISDNASPSAGGLGSIEATRVAMAAALICGRAGCVRKAAALVAIAASSHSMFGRNQVIQFYIWVHVTL